MVCYHVLAQFAFSRHKPVLVGTHIKKQNTKAFLVDSGLPFGSGTKIRRFFKTKKEAVRYVSYLRRVYKGRIVPRPPLPGGQQYLF
jgi:catabolite regulation protein CreA